MVDLQADHIVFIVIPSSVCIEQDNKANSFITCSWQWITAVSIVFAILLLA